MRKTNPGPGNGSVLIAEQRPEASLAASCSPWSLGQERAIGIQAQGSEAKQALAIWRQTGRALFAIKQNGILMGELSIPEVWQGDVMG